MSEDDFGDVVGSEDAPEVYARIAEVEVHVIGGSYDSLEDVSDRFEAEWDRVVETYDEYRESSGWN